MVVSTGRRIIQQASLNEFPLPNESDDNFERTFVGMVTAIKGQSLFEISVPTSQCSFLETKNNTNDLIEGLLVEIPNRYKNTLWIKRGGFVLVKFHSDATTKILGHIEHVLFEPQIKHIKKCGLWPKEFP